MSVCGTGEAFRPRVDEVVKWVVRSPFLSDYDPATKCDLFQQVLRIRITGCGCVEDVVAMWCEGLGNAKPSWNNLLLTLEESGCSCLLQTARCLRANLAGVLFKLSIYLSCGYSMCLCGNLISLCVCVCVRACVHACVCLMYTTKLTLIFRSFIITLFLFVQTNNMLGHTLN